MADRFENAGGVGWRRVKARAEGEELRHPEITAVESMVNELRMKFLEMANAGNF